MPVRGELADTHRIDIKLDYIGIIDNVHRSLNLVTDFYRVIITLHRCVTLHRSQPMSLQQVPFLPCLGVGRPSARGIWGRP